tara:strand:+ start:412 stop:1179 length:768 start_codon:yes stop_codon:yes gene_type:complete
MNTATQRPEPGTAYLLFGGGGRTMVPIGRDDFPVGQHVSYGDMANGRQHAIVTEAEGGPNGQPCIFVDDLHTGNVSQAVIDGPGGWQLEEETADAATVEDLKQRAEAKQARLHKAREEGMEEAARIRERGKAAFEAAKPPWAKAAIVAELKQDDSDIMTDYFHSTTKRTIFLAWSKHTRDLFPEMRKAARNHPDTAHLADAPPDAEHREKWSMGAGFYLKEADRHADGWKVSKWSLHPGSMASLFGQAEEAAPDA